MRFSFWPLPTQSFEEMKQLGQHVERTGWDGMWFADHFMPNAEDTSTPWPEAWTTLSGIAALIPRIRLGTLVSGNTYRHPAVLAKMAATVDQLSGGRVVLGLGSGWQENEHRQYGIPFYTINGRLRRLEEACQVIKALFSEQRANLEGKYYQLQDATLEPKPQKTPLLIGGGGEKLTLKIAAKYADEWNVWGTVETMIHKMSVLDKHCEDVGRNPDDIQRSAVALMYLSEDESYIGKIKERAGGQSIIAGNVNEVRDVVGAYDEAGVDELIVPDFTMGRGQQKLDTLDRFINEVAPVAR